MPTYGYQVDITASLQCLNSTKARNTEFRGFLADSFLPLYFCRFFLHICVISLDNTHPGMMHVRDHKGMGCNVALIECTWVREDPKGVGILEGRVQGAGWGTGGVSLRATWD
jgi:hypothetical protein